MSVIIGIDPHKLLHAARAIDERETELARLEVRTNASQVSDLLTWAAPFECRSWAIESAGTAWSALETWRLDIEVEISSLDVIELDGQAGGRCAG